MADTQAQAEADAQTIAPQVFEAGETQKPNFLDRVGPAVRNYSAKGSRHLVSDLYYTGLRQISCTGCVRPSSMLRAAFRIFSAARSPASR